MARSSRPVYSKIGVESAGSSVCASSLGSQIRTRLSSASSGRIGTKCSICTSSKRSSRCSYSLTNGSSATTTSGLTKVSAVCHRSPTCRDQQRSEILVIDCLLDGEAYARLRALQNVHHRKPRSIRNPLCANDQELWRDSIVESSEPSQSDAIQDSVLALAIAVRVLDSISVVARVDDRNGPIKDASC